MIDYLCDKFQAADKLEKIDCVKSEDKIKECIFKGLPADQYRKHIREIWGNTLSVIGDELIKFEKELKKVIVKGEVNAAGVHRRLDRMKHVGDIIVILTLVMSVLFGVASSPLDGMFLPFQEHKWHM